MSIESDADWIGLRRVSEVVRLALDALTAAVRPGITTGALDRIAADLFRAHGATSAPADVYGFPGSVLISVNDEVVHGVPGPRLLKEGDLVTLDVTTALDGYVADAARTVVIGNGDPVSVALAACAERAFEAALPAARAGNKVSAIGREVERAVKKAGFTVIHDLQGHGVGRTIHESPAVPNYFDPRQQDILTEGLVLTIEPLICSGSGRVRIGPDGWTVRTRDRSRAAHHEHTIVITRGEPVVLTAGFPAHFSS
jgi:methionyl aminopeptidase